VSHLVVLQCRGLVRVSVSSHVHSHCPIERGCCFLFYLTTLLVAKAIKRRMLGGLRNNEIERMWQGVSVSSCEAISRKFTVKNWKNNIEGPQKEPPEQESVLLTIQPRCSFTFKKLVVA
jgi:hypothetical protein